MYYSQVSGRDTYLICTGLIFLTGLCILAHTSVMLFTFDCHSAGLHSSTIQCFHLISDSTHRDICSSCHSQAFLQAACPVSPVAFITCSRQQAIAVLSVSFICFSQNTSHEFVSNWNKSSIGSVPPFYPGGNLWTATWRTPCQKCFSFPSWWVRNTSAHGNGQIFSQNTLWNITWKGC